MEFVKITARWGKRCRCSGAKMTLWLGGDLDQIPKAQLHNGNDSLLKR